MGVFSWFRRKPAATVEASKPEASAGAPTGNVEKSEVIDGAPGTPASAEFAEEVVPVVAATGAADAAAETVAPPVSGGTATEAVEIPRQQSAEEAADSEAGEGARK